MMLGKTSLKMVSQEVVQTEFSVVHGLTRMHGLTRNEDILLKAKNVNERRLRYLPVQEKVQKYDDTLEIENYIWSHVCQTLCNCQSVMISVVTSRFWRQRHDFGGNVINVDVNFDGRLRHSALMEFRAVST